MKILLAITLFLSFHVSADQCATEQNILDQLSQDLISLQAALDAKTQEIADQQIVVDAECNEPPPPPPEPTNWAQALVPYIPENPREIRIIPNTSITPFLLPDDGSKACDYLKCHRSTIALHDWVGMSFDYETGTARFIAMGGHADHGANSVYRFDMATMSWTRDFDYSQPKAPFPNLIDADGDGNLECTELEQGPMGTHSYDGAVYVNSIDASLLFRVSGYQPKKPRCKRVDMDKSVFVWHDAGYYESMGVPEVTFPKTHYDAERDRVLIGSQKGPEGEGIYDFNPHTMQFIKLSGLWMNKGGSLTMDGRDIYVTSNKVGLFKGSISLQGELSPFAKIATEEEWAGKGSGLAASKGIVVAWDGANGIAQYDSNTGTIEQFQAAGDLLPTAHGGLDRVYGKFVAVPELPGIFIGISDNYGWVIYRAF